MAFLGLDGLVVYKALTLATLAVCPVEPAPKVDVHFATEKPYYNEAATSSALKQSMSKDKESTLATDKRAAVMGVTTSITSHNLRVSYKLLTDSSGNQCIYVDRAVFWITYRPAIFVSADIVDLPCSLAVTQAHENQHVDIDIRTMQEYLPRIRFDMLLYLQSLGYQGFGPYPVAEAEKHKVRLTQAIQAAGAPMVEKLREARRQRQGIIDTEENYKHEASKCPQERGEIYKRLHQNR